jgi:hypothetical protein
MLALGALCLAPQEQDVGRAPTLPSVGNEIRRHIMIHMRLDASYDDLQVFSSYTSLITHRVREGPTSPDDTNDIPEAFPPHLHNALGVIAALVARGHVPTIDDLGARRDGRWWSRSYLRCRLPGLGLRSRLPNEQQRWSLDVNRSRVVYPHSPN